MAAGRRTDDIAELVERARNGEPRAVARLISLVEDESPKLPALAKLLRRYPGSAQVVGVTGAPGVGKSTTTSALIGALRASGCRVGVLAVDPSSPFSGGALLGDRIRMTEHATDDGVFIRSMATRGKLGGLSAAVPQALRILDAAGFDVVLVETVGVGQSEIEVVRLADTTVVLLAPGMGDGVQAAKAGILEIADIFVVNKADRDGAVEVSRQLRHLQALAGTGSGASADGASAGSVSAGSEGANETGAGRWQVPILTTVAIQAGGVSELVTAIAAHRSWLAGSGGLRRRRASRARHEVEAIAVSAIRRRLAEIRGAATLAEVAGQVAAGELDPYAAAEQLLAALPAS